MQCQHAAILKKNCITYQIVWICFIHCVKLSSEHNCRLCFNVVINFFSSVKLSCCCIDVCFKYEIAFLV